MMVLVEDEKMRLRVVKRYIESVSLWRKRTFKQAYNVYFCDLLIGRFFEEISKIKDVIERVPTRPLVVECCNPCTRIGP